MAKALRYHLLRPSLSLSTTLACEWCQREVTEDTGVWITGNTVRAGQTVTMHVVHREPCLRLAECSIRFSEHVRWTACPA